MAYYTCNDCNNYDPERTNYKGWGYCTERCSYYPKSEPACGSKFDHKSDHVSTCFLTTAMCNIFKFEDNCLCLEVLRKFRDTVLVGDVKYHKLLAEYEFVGPTLSSMLYRDEHRDEVASYYFENYIYDIFMNLSTRKDYNEAVDKYVEMVNDIKRMYGVTKEVSDNDVAVLTKKIQNKQYKVKRK